MLPQVVPVGAVRTDRSSTDTSTATAMPACQPRATAHASTAPITQNGGTVDACRASIASLSTRGVTSRVAAVTSRSAKSSGRPRRRGASYAQTAARVHTTITPTTVQPSTGRSNSRQRVALSPTA